MSDACNTFVFFGAAIYRHALSEDVGISDDDLGRRAFVGKVLRFCTDYAARKKAVIATD
jgi:hypothetical protein